MAVSEAQKLVMAYKKKFTMRTASAIEPIKVIPTNFPSVDRGVFGIGGFPRGRLCEVYGEESGGKSTFMMHCVAELLRSDSEALVVWIDAENSWTIEWATKFGIDHERVLLPAFGTGEEAFDIICQLVDQVDLIVVDSIAELIPQIVSERGDDKNPRIAAFASMITQGIADISAGRHGTPLKYSKTALIFINQIRDAVGVMYGDPIETPGGHRSKHAASIRLEVKKQGLDNEVKDDDGNPLRQRVRLRTKKNKMAPPFRETSLWISFRGEIIEDTSWMISAAVDKGILTGGAGGRYVIVDITTGEEIKIHGKEALMEYILGSEPIKEFLMSTVEEGDNEEDSAEDMTTTMPAPAILPSERSKGTAGDPTANMPVVTSLEKAISSDLKT